jgi:hypothetical protein
MSRLGRAGDKPDRGAYTLSMLRRLAFLFLAFALILGPVAGMEGAAHAHAASDHAMAHAAAASHDHCDEPAKAAAQVQLCASCPCAIALTSLAATTLESLAAQPSGDHAALAGQAPSSLAAPPQPRPPRA